jgi:hypothetical protein
LGSDPFLEKALYAKSGHNTTPWCRPFLVTPIYAIINRIQQKIEDKPNGIT